MYVGPLGGTVVQIKVTPNPVTGQSQYAFRRYLSGLPTPNGVAATGVGIADDLRSLIVFSDLSSIALAGAEQLTRLPLCEDM
jgi:hypothetical protein